MSHADHGEDIHGERQRATQQQREALKEQIRNWLKVTGSQTLFLEVYVVLGKALLNQKVTREGIWRLVEAIRHAFSRVSPAFPLVIFTGWAGDPPAARSEGELLKRFFTAFGDGSGFRWKGGVLAEEEARDTFGNIKRALALLKEVTAELSVEFPKVRVVILRFFLVSSDYHLERAEEVDEFLAEISDLQPLRKEGREVVLLKVPYLFASCGNDLCEWLSTGYRQLHRLVLLQINLQGLGGNLYLPKKKREKDIPPGSVGELRRVAFDRLDETIKALTVLSQRKPTDQSRGSWLDKYLMALEKLPGVSEKLRTLQDELAPYVGKPYDPHDQKNWVAFAQRLHEATGELRTKIMDPDESSHGTFL